MEQQLDADVGKVTSSPGTPWKMRASPAPVEEQGLSPAGLKELVARKAELELEELVARKELVARQAELVARLEETRGKTLSVEAAATHTNFDSLSLVELKEIYTPPMPIEFSFNVLSRALQAADDPALDKAAATELVKSAAREIGLPESYVVLRPGGTFEAALAAAEAAAPRGEKPVVVALPGTYPTDNMSINGDEDEEKEIDVLALASGVKFTKTGERASTIAISESVQLTFMGGFMHGDNTCWMTFDGVRIETQYNDACNGHKACCVRLTRCVMENSSSDDGGAIKIGSRNVLEAIGCTFRNNAATDHGGAVYVMHTAKCELTACTFVNNTAANSGGALSVADATVRSCTFALNEAPHGNAVFWSCVGGPLSGDPENYSEDASGRVYTNEESTETTLATDMKMPACPIS